ncbi:MAG: hypothetical protein WBG92_11910 [Thiohalocapsa sp.]
MQDKLRSIIDAVERDGHAEITRLTVLKRWFDRPTRLRRFGFLIAQWAATQGPSGSADSNAQIIFVRARELLAEATPTAVASPAR